MLVIHLCNHVITSDYISIPCGLVIALYCTYDRDIFFEYCLVTVVPCRVQGPSFITNWRRGLTGRMTSTAGGEGEPPAAPAAAAVSAGPLGLYGVVATFDPNQDDWCERGVCHWAMRRTRFRNLLNKRKISRFPARFQDFTQDFTKISGLKSPFCACAMAPPRVQRSGTRSPKFSRLMRMRNIMNPPILAMIYGNSTEISQISRKISRFQRRFHRFHERFQDFNGDFTDFTKDFRDYTDFTKDFRISTEISGFRERFQISREISGKVYEISVSGGPYIERLEHYFSANDIASPAKRRGILLTAVGASTYRLIRTLVSPAKVSEVSFADIVDRAKAHFNPKPSPIVKCFEFNT